MPACSPALQKYFDELQEKTKKLYEIAQAARAKNYDPESVVDIPLATSIAQRVEALISSVAPQLRDSGAAKRIEELEKQYGPGDWRVALTIAKEVAQEKFCKFKDMRESMEVGIRMGFAYMTLGVVSAPLEGLVEIKLKKRKDGKDYLALYYAGPSRGAGGTALAASIVISDYVRRAFNIADYDITDEEVKRYQVEIDDYCTKVAHRQYVPTAEELELLMRSVGIEITGDPTEKYEVSQCKHMERVETDIIRGGMALVLTEGPTLKAEKVWKQLSKWSKDFGLEHWSWLKDFIELKTKLHSGGAKTDEKIKPIDSYLRDLVAGRPVFSYPMRSGGFRLCYGRSRLSGFASTGVHPATMQVLNNYVATGTQIKTERPGKATVFTPCDSIEGPIVKLNDGSVVVLRTEQEAKAVKNKVGKILFLGDILISYGDFSENGQRLVPCGYNEEWWSREVEKALENKQELKEKYAEFLKDENVRDVSAAHALEMSQILEVPLHPRHTYFFNEIATTEFLELCSWFKSTEAEAKPAEPKIKEILEKIGCPHTIGDEKIIFSKDEFEILSYLANCAQTGGIKLAASSQQPAAGDGLQVIPSNTDLSTQSPQPNTPSTMLNADPTGEPIINYINKISKIKIRDRAGTFIGTRMGRPEKAKLRKLKGSPVGLFPVGREGDRLRSLQAAMNNGRITADFPIFECFNCNAGTIYPTCEKCGAKTEKLRYCPLCKKRTKNPKCHTETIGFEKKKLDVQHYVTAAMNKLKVTQLPPLIKGVRGTWNKDRILENLSKAILRAKHQLAVNKDGTIRFDMTELGCTHFKPAEIGTSVEKLRLLGYTEDKDGLPLENENQVVEIRPQDVILPCNPECGDEPADVILIRICNFTDELLEKFYGLPSFYNVKTRDDLIGQIVIGLAPHTSAGTAGRIIGFSRTQGGIAHPYWHAAQRRNFDGDETCVILALDAFLNFSRQYLPDRRGAKTMDAPLVLSTVLDPTEVDTEVHGLDIASQYSLQFYEAAQNYAWPWEVQVEQVKSRLGKPQQYEGIKYTHSVSDMNAGVLVSAYKSIPTMLEKLEGQLDLTSRLRGIDVQKVALLVIDKHFIRDIKGNMRKFTSQEYRCVSCNAKFRRPPLSGVCAECNGKLLFTIAEGSIKKYLDASLKLSKLCPEFMQQSLKLLNQRIESIFGKEQTKQIGLGGWFG